MDLGIADRKAIVCASSKGLGRACARALAEAGCAVVLNGRDKQALEQTAREIRQATGVEVREILGDLDHAETRAELIAACPDADILINNNGGPPYQAFGEIKRENILKGIEVEHADPDRAGAGARARHGQAQVWPNRQHHLGFGPGADRRARRVVGGARGLDCVPRLGGEALCARQCDDQLDPARVVRDRAAEIRPRAHRGAAGRERRDRARRIRRRESRRGDSATPRSSARSAPSWPARMRDSSPVRTFSSTAAPSRGLFDAAFLAHPDFERPARVGRRPSAPIAEPGLFSRPIDLTRVRGP